jgi:hypothetical protein
MVNRDDLKTKLAQVDALWTRVAVPVKKAADSRCGSCMSQVLNKRDQQQITASSLRECVFSVWGWALIDEVALREQEKVIK